MSKADVQFKICLPQDKLAYSAFVGFISTGGKSQKVLSPCILVHHEPSLTWAKNGEGQKTHLLALFLQIYQQVWKFENEDVKIINIFFKNYAETKFKLLYLSSDSWKKINCKAKHFFRHPDLRLLSTHLTRVNVQLSMSFEKVS
jgi:hypothetical protein